MAKNKAPVDEVVEVTEVEQPTPQQMEVPTPAPESPKAPKVQTRSSGTALIGIANRRNSSIIVNLKKDSFVLSAGARTGKDYKQTDIVSINNMTLQQAVMKGICAILR